MGAGKSSRDAVFLDFSVFCQFGIDIYHMHEPVDVMVNVSFYASAQACTAFACQVEGMAERISPCSRVNGPSGHSLF